MVKWDNELRIGSSLFHRTKYGSPFYWNDENTDRVFLEDNIWICIFKNARGSGNSPKEAYINAIDMFIEQENEKHMCDLSKLLKEKELV